MLFTTLVYMVYCLFVVTASDCDEDVDDYCVRLADGPGPWAGMVEVYHEGRWGTVGLRLDREGATVVCRELGYTGGVATLYESSKHMWLRGVECNGTEERLPECRHQGWGGHEGMYSSIHAIPRNLPRDAGVFCTAVRLKHGINTMEGYVEVIRDGVWGGVCGDGWDDLDAAVVCRELHYAGGVAWTGDDYVEDTSTVWMDEVACNGTEAGVSLCSHRGWGNHDCSSRLYAGVTCSIGLRLANGSTNSSEGRVEVFQNNEWGSVCKQYFDDNTARVVCRELGYAGAEQIFYAASRYGLGAGRVWLRGGDCDGTEDRLVDCMQYGDGEFRGYCEHDRDVGVACRADTVHPSVYTLTPTYGPAAGGTILTVAGDNLNYWEDPVIYYWYEKRHVLLCQAVNRDSHVNTSATEFACKTEELKSASTLGKTLELKLSWREHSSRIRLNHTFTYKSNPHVTKLYPLDVLIEGNIKITVEGSSFTSVNNPQLLTTVLRNSTEEQRDYTTTCTVLSSVKMQCEAPDISDFYMEQIESKDYVVYRGLLLDGVDAYRDLRYSHISQYSRGFVQRIPSVEQFSESPVILKTWWPHKAHAVTITGSHMDIGDLISQYAISVGNTSCDMSSAVVTDNSIVFLPPGDKPDDDSVVGEELDVILYLANARLSPGRVKYESSILECVPCAAGLFASLVFITTVGAAVICIIYMKHKETGATNNGNSRRKLAAQEQQHRSKQATTDTTSSTMEDKGTYLHPQTSVELAMEHGYCEVVSSEGYYYYQSYGSGATANPALPTDTNHPPDKHTIMPPPRLMSQYLHGNVSMKH